MTFNILQQASGKEQAQAAALRLHAAMHALSGCCWPAKSQQAWLLLPQAWSLLNVDTWCKKCLS